MVGQCNTLPGALWLHRAGRGLVAAPIDPSVLGRRRPSQPAGICLARGVGDCCSRILLGLLSGTAAVSADQPSETKSSLKIELLSVKARKFALCCRFTWRAGQQTTPNIPAISTVPVARLSNQFFFEALAVQKLFPVHHFPCEAMTWSQEPDAIDCRLSQAGLLCITRPVIQHLKHDAIDRQFYMSLFGRYSIFWLAAELSDYRWMKSTLQSWRGPNTSGTTTESLQAEWHPSSLFLFLQMKSLLLPGAWNATAMLIRKSPFVCRLLTIVDILTAVSQQGQSRIAWGRHW